MPIKLEFKTNDPTIELNTETRQVLCKILMGIPEMPTDNCSTGFIYNSDGTEVVAFVINLLGMDLVDDVSSNAMLNIISAKLREHKSPFYVSRIFLTTHTEGEIIFTHRRLEPRATKNQTILDELGVKDDDIPEEFKCSISSQVMDTPKYDIRAPSARYDENFLNYWLIQNSPQIMPTRHTHVESCIETDYDLLSKIALFIKEMTAKEQLKKLHQTLTKFRVEFSPEEEIKALNLGQALRRAVLFGNEYDIDILVRFKVDINEQDTNPEKRYTALHLAMRKKKFRIISPLLYAGAKLDIKDAKGKTALDLLKTFPMKQQREFIFIAKALKLIPETWTPAVLSGGGQTTLFSTVNPAGQASSNTQDAENSTTATVGSALSGT